MADKPSDDRASFGFYPQLKRNRSKQDREAAKNVPVDLARGFVSGVLGAPGDIESFLRIPYDYLRAPTMSELVTGDKTSKTYLPTSEDIEKRLPFRSNTPVSKAASGLGALAGGFYYGPGSPLKVIGALPGAVRHGAKEFAKASYAGAPNVVKREGGNWIENTIDNSIRGLKKPNAPQVNDIDWLQNHRAEKLAKGENVDLIDEAINSASANTAMDKWVESKIGRYVKSEMGTPSDPIRLMIERREAEIADKFLKDQARANRMADRAAEEVDPRRKANLTRQAQRMLDDAVAQRDLAMEHTSHLPRGFQNVEANPAGDDILESVRRAEGFPEKGMGTTPSSRAWENKADMSIYPINVGEIQSYPAKKLSRQQAIEDYNAYEKTLDKDVVDYLKGKGFEDKHMAGLMKLSGEEKAQIVGDTNLKELLDAIPPYSPKEPIYELAGKESYISKLDPQSSVYSGDISGLHFDHIIDVLKQDLAARRITPEQLNRITMEQAVRRTADYDLERSVAMREAKIKQQEGFPIHKEYPEEGYKWIELAPPKELPAGYRVIQSEMGEGFKVLDAAGNEAVATASRPTNNMGHTNIPFHKTEQEAIADALKYDKRLEEALKYEGDTMGHCVGGYCPDVASGRSRIFSLRDSKGEPHVTVEVQPVDKHPIGYGMSGGKSFPDDFRYESGSISPEQHQQIYQRAKQLFNPELASDLSSHRMDVFQQAANEIIGKPADQIIQIKGKQNLRPIEKYDPYTQDFLKSGNWSDTVGDFENTGLYRADPYELGMTLPKAPDLQDLPLNRGELLSRAKQAGLFPEGQKYLTRDEWEDIVRKQYQAEQQAQATRKAQMSKPFDEGDIGKLMGGLEPEMKRGGRVSISKNLDTMMLEVNNKRIKPVRKAEGGYLKKPAAYINGDEFVNAAKKYGIKDSMNNLNKIVDLVNKGLSVDDAARQVADSGVHKAAGGAINADDLILEERPL